MVKKSAVPSFSHLLTGTWSLSKHRQHSVLRLTYRLPATFDKAEMSFSNLNVALLIWHHYTPSRCLPRGGMLCLKDFSYGFTSHWLLVWYLAHPMRMQKTQTKGALSSQQLRPVAVNTGPVAPTANQERRADAAIQVGDTSPLKLAGQFDLSRCGGLGMCHAGMGHRHH